MVLKHALVPPPVEVVEAYPINEWGRGDVTRAAVLHKIHSSVEEKQSIHFGVLL